MAGIVEAEKGSHINLQTLHTRLRVVEVVVLLSLLLSLVQGYVAMHAQHEVNQMQQQTGVR